MGKLLHSIKTKILILIILSAIAVSAALFLIYYQTYHRHMERELLLSSENDIQYSQNYINFHMTNIDNFIKWCQNNESVIQYAESPTTDNKVAAYDSLSQIYNTCTSNTYICRMIIASDFDEYIQLISAAYSSAIDMEEAIAKIPDFEHSLQNPGQDFSKGILIDPFRKNNPKDVLLLVRPIHNPFSPSLTGWILVEISTELFSDAFTNYATDPNDQYYLSIEDQDYILEDNRFVPLDRPLPLKNTAGTAKENGMYFTGSRFKTYPFFIIKETRLSPGIQNSRDFIFYIGFILLLMVLFSVLIMLYLYYLVNRPVLKLQRQLAVISQGEFSPSPDIEWDNEFGDIGRGINQLAVKIRQMIQEKLDSETARQRIEYELLQNQVSPHFLYNTLSSIKWLATLQGATGISDVVSALASLLKKIVRKNGASIPLSEELELLQDYFSIQKFRYGGTISLQYDIEDESLLNCRILHFTLQPIVENAIFHGIEPQNAPGLITVRVFSPDEAVLQIDVTDNGIGMSPETVTQLLSDTGANKSGFFQGIGIKNVHERLQLEYGPSYGLNIRSSLGEYTTISIKIPFLTYTKETVQNDENPDC